MLEYSERTHQLMQAKYQYELQDVAEPNLYREIFGLRVHSEDRLQQPSGAHQHACRHLDDRHHLPRRPAERQPLQSPNRSSTSSSWKAAWAGPRA